VDDKTIVITMVYVIMDSRKNLKRLLDHGAFGTFGGVFLANRCYARKVTVA